MLPRSEPSESLICRRGVEDKQDAIELNFWEWKRMGNGIVMLPLAKGIGTRICRQPSFGQDRREKGTAPESGQPGLKRR